MQPLLYDLAPSQIPEWYAYQLNPQSSVYNISFNHFFFKQIDVNIFCKAWQKILDRHIVFRIHFAYQDGKPKQLLLPPISLQVENILIDKTMISENEVNILQNKLAQEYALKPFNFETGPLFRLHLVAYPKNEFQLIFTVHHIIWDETSTMNLIREFTEIYTAHLEQRQAILPVLNASYLDYVKYVNDAIISGKYDQHKKYWLDLFKTIPSPLELPSDFSRPAVQTYNGNTLNQWLPRKLIRDIQIFISQNNTTLFILLLTVLDLYFYRISGQNDFVLGCPIAGRDQAVFKDLIGCFAVPMPIRCQIHDQLIFSDLLKHVETRVIEAFEHYHYPCNQVIESLIHQKDLSRPKLFSIMAGVQNNKSEFIHLPLGEGSLYAKEVYSAENHGARFDLAIGLDPLGGDIKFFCTYNTDLFKKESVVRILNDITYLFAEVIVNPTLPLKSYSLLSPSMRQKIIFDFNATDYFYNKKETLIDLFFYQANLSKEKAALHYINQTISYNMLSERIAQFASYFYSDGVRKGDFVCILLEPGIDLIICLLAVLKLGAIYVPINHEWPEARVQEVATYLSSAIIVTQDNYLPLANKLLLKVINIEHIKLKAQNMPAYIENHASPTDLAYLLFTSGTTGKPKAIPILHSGIMNLLYSTQKSYCLNENDRVLFWTSCSFDPSVLEIFWTLCFGAQVVIAPPQINRLPEQALLFIEQMKITVLQTVPTMLEALCAVKKYQGYLRLIICGAALMHKVLRDQALEIFKCRLMNHYGPTEVTVDALSFDCSQDFVGARVPLGKPLDNVKVFILDENDEPVPLGVTGEITIASPGLTPGYLHDPMLTNTKFFNKQFAEDSILLRLYRTGDLGKFDENGLVYFCGRKDNQVKINGNRVELEEIESLLLQHPELAKVALQFTEEESESKLRAYLEFHEHALNVFESRGEKYYQYTLAQQPQMLRLMNSIHHDTWPRYFEGSPFLSKYWKRLINEFPEYQFCLLDKENNIATVANGIPFYWSGEKSTVPSGWDEGVELAFQQKTQGIQPNTIIGLAGIVRSNYQGRNLSTQIVRGFRALAKMHKLDHFLGPVRPVGMFDHGIKDVHIWAKSRDKNNEPLDYWLRVHERLGAKNLGVAPQSQLVEGSLDDWEKWTGQRWNTSGEYYLEDTLQSIEVNVEKNYARYFDPSIWVSHSNLQNEATGLEKHITISDFRAYLASKLPAYMLPNEFYLITKIPLNENGKINLRALPNFSQQQRTQIAQPESAIQICLIEIWKNVLARDGFGIRCDFFHLGGQSLKVIKMLFDIEQEYKIKISLQEFYHQPTIEHLEKLIVNKINLIKGK